MANAAAKKAAKAGSSASNKNGIVIGASTLFFIIYRCFYKYPTLGWLQLLGFLLHEICLVISYLGMVECARNNTPSNYYFDLLVVSVISQVLKVNMIYLTPPPPHTHTPLCMILFSVIHTINNLPLQVVSCFSEWGFAIILIVPCYLAKSIFSSGALGALQKATGAASPTDQVEDDSDRKPTGRNSGHEKKKIKYVR